MNAGILAMRFGDGTNIVQIVLIVCVFWVLISGRDSIRNLALFRAGCLMLAGSLILPVVYVFMTHFFGEQLLRELDLPFTLLEYAMGPLLTFASFPFLVMSLVPGKDRGSQSE